MPPTRAPIGAALRLKDPAAQYEVDRLYHLLQNFKVGRDTIDAKSVAAALGKTFRDGQLDVLNRVLRGETAAERIVIQNDSDSVLDHALDLLVTGDRQACKIERDTIADAQLGAIEFKSDDGGTGNKPATVDIEQKGTGMGLRVRKTLTSAGQSATNPPVVVEADTEYIGKYIRTTAGSVANGAHLSNAGVWTPACSIRGKRDRRRPLAAWFFEALCRVRTWTWKSRRDGSRHIGPCREDFERAFGTDGMGDYDLGGAALMGVQFLLERLEALELEVKRLKNGSRTSKPNQ
jgi:hypothetical protein